MAKKSKYILRIKKHLEQPTSLINTTNQQPNPKKQPPNQNNTIFKDENGEVRDFRKKVRYTRMRTFCEDRRRNPSS